MAQHVIIGGNHFWVEDNSPENPLPVIFPYDHGHQAGLADDDHTQYQLRSELTATPAEINQALDGISANVTFTNLNDLTDGGATALHSHAGILTATVPLSNTQIRDTPGGTSLFELVAAPGAGYRLDVLYASGVLDAAAGAYTNIDAADCACSLKIGTFASASVALVNAVFDATFGDAHIRVLPFSQPSDPSNAGRMVSPPTLAVIENQPINLEIYNNLGALTGGNVANSMTVTLFYAVVPV